MDRVVDCAFRVHRAVGPGLLESIYRKCLLHEIKRNGLRAEEEVWLPLHYEDLLLDRALRADIVVEGTIIVEVKAIETLLGVHRAQVVTYLRASGLPAGLLVNFHVEYFKQGYDRLVNPALLSATRVA